MSSNLKVNTILPSTGTNIGIGTAGGTVTIVGDVDIADKIVHTGDTNTSIRFPSAIQLQQKLLVLKDFALHQVVK